MECLFNDFPYSEIIVEFLTEKGMNSALRAFERI